MMKRAIAMCLIAGYLLSLTACKARSDSESAPTPSPESTSSGVSSESAASESTAAKEKELAVTPMPIQTVSLEPENAQEPDVSPLYYTDSLGVRKSFPNSLPGLLAFEYPYVYYERMAPEDNSAAPLTVGRYSFETKKTEEIVLADFNTGDGRCLLSDSGRMIYKYHRYGADDHLECCFVLLDFTAQTQTMLASAVTDNLEGDCAMLNEHEAVLLYNEQGSAQTEEIVVRCDLDSGETTEICRDDFNADGSTRDIWAITAADDRIYLLMQQITDRQMHLYLRTLDRDGQQITETELSALQRHYPLPNEGAEQMNLLDGHLFIRFSKWSAPNWGEPSMICMRKDTDGLHFEGQINAFPRRKIGESAPEDGCIWFDLHRDADSIFRYSTKENSAAVFKLNLSEPDDMIHTAVDSSGNILAFVRGKDADKTNAYLYPAEYVQSLLS